MAKSSMSYKPDQTAALSSLDKQWLGASGSGNGALYITLVYKALFLLQDGQCKRELQLKPNCLSYPSQVFCVIFTCTTVNHFSFTWLKLNLAMILVSIIDPAK